MMPEIIMLIKAIVTAILKPLTSSKELKIASGIVCVIPTILPANISVAPNSPTERDHASKAPTIIEFLKFGIRTKTTFLKDVAPSINADSV
jgi:hypothetical protein